METFRTGDLALATTLRVHGHEHRGMELEGQNAVWVFDFTSGVRALVSQYHDGEVAVEPREYNKCLRKTRQQMFGFLKRHGLKPPHQVRVK